LLTPRLSLKNHMGSGFTYVGSSTATSLLISTYNATAQKLLRARVTFTPVPDTPAGAGKIWLLRRRDYTSLP